MQRMPGVDAGYFYMETPALHMHTLKIAVLEPPAGGYHFDMLREELDRRLHLLPPFCRRVVRVPGGLYHPMWFEDADIDVADHVHRVVLPGPGTCEQVEDVIGEIASRPLDRSRPLWEAHAIEGLEGGRIVMSARCITRSPTASHRPHCSRTSWTQPPLSARQRVSTGTQMPSLRAASCSAT